MYFSALLSALSITFPSLNLNKGPKINFYIYRVSLYNYFHERPFEFFDHYTYTHLIQNKSKDKELWYLPINENLNFLFKLFPLLCTIS